MAERIIAAGGIVKNENGEILLQLRKGKWDLPKGKLDKGESIEECAVREVEEETGLKNVQLGELIGTTLHNYTEKGVEIEKETFWYDMRVTGEQKLVPQVEEDIHDLKWVRERDLCPFLKNTYDNIIDIVEKYFDNNNQIN